jgi:DNA-binding winged helix-turn-helix (wHTH) protein
MNVRFGEFRFDDETRQLYRRDAEVHLSPKAFDLLRMLLEARPKALSKAELSERLWPATFVSEANLSVLIAEIRGVLKDRARAPRLVRTVHRFGYAFSGSAVDVKPSERLLAGSARSYWLVLGSRRIALTDGENVLGRDPHVAVWLDVPGVSRRHARIVIVNQDVTIEDLGSKNGTYVGGERVTSPATLRNGDEIRTGSALVTFRIWSQGGSTETQSLSGARRHAR